MRPDDTAPTRRRRPARRLVGPASVVALVLVLAACASAGEPAPPAAPVGASTVEEARRDGPVPREILARSGFADVAPDLARALEGARSFAEAEQLVTTAGQQLWRRAVDRVQGRGPQVGDLSRDDDRPLYWARLGAAAALRSWRPREGGLDDGQRARLLSALESASRGQDTIGFPGRYVDGARRVLVTGFDPFQLDRDPRRSNPSGAAALALDGTVADTPAGPVRLEAAVFPVRWTDFADGAVERVLEGVLPQVDLFTTISQGSPGRFDLERTNGAWRGGSPDNEDLSRTGPIPVADQASAPQWTSTTLPSRELAAANTGRFPVVDHTVVEEIPAGADEPVSRPDGPTPGSAARSGGGGDYLSNEIAYRATLVRDRLGLRDRLPGGHLHTPVLGFGPGATDPVVGGITDEVFVRNRLDIVGQTRAIVLAATDAAAPRR